MVLPPGSRFDRYTIEALVGSGGMGKVYSAMDTRLRRRVALKVLEPPPCGDGHETVLDALREARAAAAITHPHATAIFDADEIEGTSFIVMEFVPGVSLRKRIGDASIAPATRLRWLIDVAGALAAAHQAGVIHRDVKPENVMVRDDGMVKVLDFGVARLPRPPGVDPAGGEVVTLAGGGALVGTPAYMAPEQLRGAEIDDRADQFGWGVLAYELLTGKLPWKRAGDFVGYLAAVMTDEPEPLSTLVRGVPPPVEAAVHRALSKSPYDRFPNMVAAAAPLVPYARTSVASLAAMAPHALLPEPEDTAFPGGPTTQPTGPVEIAGPSSPVRGRMPSRPFGERAPSDPNLDAWRVDPTPRPTPRSSPAPLSPHPITMRTTPRPTPDPDGLREPDFGAPVDVDAHLALLPRDATCKGMFFNDMIQLASKVAGPAEVSRVAGIPERRYVAFRDYPMHENMRLKVAVAMMVYPRLPLGEALRRMGQRTFENVLQTQIGRALFGMFERDVEPLILRGPKSFKHFLSFGEVSSERLGARLFVIRTEELPVFIETFLVGMLEGVLRHCSERGRIRLAMSSLGSAIVEVELA